MPTIDVEYAELENMLNMNLQGNMANLNEILASLKGQVKLYDEREGIVSIEMKDTNRPDLWSVEGLSRALHGYLNQEKGLKQYTASKPTVEVNVNPRLWSIRPFICCSTIEDLHLTDAVIRGLMHLQDKLDKTYGTKLTSVGLATVYSNGGVMRSRL